MSAKTHRTALVVVPPDDVWAPIQAIRQEHDRQFHRWMPHINLLYPFVPVARFDDVLTSLAGACTKITQFTVTLAEFRYFRHSSGTATVWLAPEPKDALIRLQAALETGCPECNDLSRFPAGFTPHLSVGQARSVDEAEYLIHALQHAWEELRFNVASVAVILRDRDGPFAVERSIAFGPPC